MTSLAVVEAAVERRVDALIRQHGDADQAFVAACAWWAETEDPTRRWFRGLVVDQLAEDVCARLQRQQGDGAPARGGLRVTVDGQPATVEGFVAAFGAW